MCLFCDIIEKKIPSKFVYEDEKVCAILDISQVTYGHTLVMPKKHCTNILEADEETVVNLAKVVHQLSKHIVNKTNAKGCNILSNCGEVAGQTIDHFHIHIIPRFGEDDAASFRFYPSEELDLDEVLETIKI
ncbi:MAG: HIT family protein [Solobacterium sp.]|nr:HIT family protein [Solobacterium sp.]